jgi:hypothetical protein
VTLKGAGMKGFLISYLVGFLVIASLWGFAMYGATHQDSIFGDAAYVVAGIIDLPVMLLYGVDGSRQPPIIVSIAIYLIEAGVLSLFVYLIFFSRR